MQWVIKTKGNGKYSKWKQNNKGFTLVELVIVIAVIAILAGVLIGTFASVISRANQSKAVQEWKAVVDEAYVEYVADKHDVPPSVKVEGKTIEFGDCSFVDDFVALKGNVYVELDTTNKVYLVWNKDTDNSTYAVAANYNGYTEADAKDIVEAYVQAQLSKVPNATHYKLNNATAFTSIEFTPTDTDATEISLGNAFNLVTFSGKTWQDTISGSAAPYSVTVAEVTV